MATNGKFGPTPITLEPGESPQLIYQTYLANKTGKEIYQEKICCTCGPKDICQGPECACWCRSMVNLQAKRIPPDAIGLLVTCSNECKCKPRKCLNRLIKPYPANMMHIKTSQLLGTPDLGLFTTIDLEGVLLIGDVKGTALSRRTHSEYQFKIFKWPHMDQPGFVIDSHGAGSAHAFVNHHCDPNLTLLNSIHTNEDGTRLAMVMFVNRYINAGSELTVGYSDDFFVESWRLCRCGHTECRYNTYEKLDAIRREKERKTAAAKRRSKSETRDHGNDRQIGANKSNRKLSLFEETNSDVENDEKLEQLKRVKVPIGPNGRGIPKMAMGTSQQHKNLIRGAPKKAIGTIIKQEPDSDQENVLPCEEDDLPDDRSIIKDQNKEFIARSKAYQKLENQAGKGKGGFVLPRPRSESEVRPESSNAADARSNAIAAKAKMCGQKGGVKNGKPNAGGEKKGAGQKKNGADEELGRLVRANRELIEANRALTAEERADLLDEESGDYATANEFSDEEENAEADKEEEADQAGTPISQDPMPKE